MSRSPHLPLRSAAMRIALATLPLVGACAAPPPPNLVLLTLDTTRADALGCYGSPTPTPHLDRLAREGTRAERAYTTVPFTTPAHASILTGRYPTHTGVHLNGDAVLHGDLTTLAEHLHARGYRTAASVSAFVTTSVWGLDQGFDAYFDDLSQAGSPEPRQSGRWARERPADAVVDDLLPWLEQTTGPFFIWAHFYDPHQPYQAPIDGGDTYAGEVAWMDTQIGRLREAVDARGGAAWIAVGDHGEALVRSHGELGHGLFLYEDSTRVPFLYRAAVPADTPVVLAEPVSLVDVLPTALALLGLPVPSGLDGRVLAPGEASPPLFLESPPIFLESQATRQRMGFAPEVAVVHGPLKLMATPSPRLYDVVADPHERSNLHASEAAAVARLSALAHAHQARSASGEAPGPAVTAQLAALGYVTPPDPVPTGRDAKDHLDLIEQIEQARTLAAAGAPPARVEAAYRAVLDREPNLAEARVGLARALAQLGRADEARDLLEAALLANPQSAVLKLNLANHLAAAGDYERGVSLCREVLDAVPGDALAQVALLRMLADQGKLDLATQTARGWLEQGDDPDLHGILGVSLTRAGEPRAALPHLQAARADGVPRQAVAQSLAVIALEAGQTARATALLEQELEAFPANIEARRVLAHLLARQQLWEEAAAELAFLAERPHPPSETAADRLDWARAVFNTGDFERARDIHAPLLPSEDPEVLRLHANLTAKLGDRAEAERIFDRARAARERQTYSTVAAPDQ